MIDYGASDARVMLQDAFIEIIRLNEELKIIRETIQGLRDDIEHLTRNLDNFNMRTAEVKNELVNDLANNATALIKTYLDDLQKTLMNEGVRKRRRWWLF